MKLKPIHSDIVDSLNAMGHEINRILRVKHKDRYFHGIALLYSNIEYLLKWLVFVNSLWLMSDKVRRKKETAIVHNFCTRLSFYNAQQLVFAMGLVDWRLYKDLEVIRKERNDILHQFWLYHHRDNKAVLRKKLEKLANITNVLIATSMRVTKHIGVDEVYNVKL